MTISRDARYAWRQIGNNPAFSITVIITLALTVGLSTAVFSVLDAVLIRPLPYNRPDRIVALQTYAPQGYTQPASFPEYQDWRRDNQVFSSLAGYTNFFGDSNLETPSGPVALHAVHTTDGFFDIFGVKPMIGRGFLPGEDEPGANPVVVLSYEVWKSAFGGNTEIVGRNVRLDGKSATVVGVMPAGFRFPINEASAIYTPIYFAKERRGRGNHWLRIIARLKQGVTIADAQSSMNGLFEHYAQVYPDTKGRRVKLLDMITFTVDNASAALRLLIYAVLALLAIGCVNVAGLLLARGVKLEREMAVRSVLGANRFVLMRQILAESVIYALAGAALGACLAYGLIVVTRTLLISALSRGADVHVNVTALVAALVLAMMTSILAGFVPALRLTKESIGMLVRSGNRVSSDRSQHRLRGAFIVAQFALALVLVVTSGLLLRALAGLRNADLGFNPDRILTVGVNPSPGRYEHRNVLADFYTPMLEKVQAIPGVKAAGVIQVLPIQSWGFNSSMAIIGQPPPPPNVEHLAELRLITPGYYAAFDDKLVRGRLPDAKRDTPSSARVAVINEAFVKKFITNGEDPIGKQFKDGDDTVTIIGVVRNIRQNIFEPPLAEFDYPISQIPPKLIPIYMPAMHLVVRTAVKPESITGELRRVFHEVDPTLPFRTPETMSTVVAGALTFERLENWLFGTFAALAALLALVGLYGLITHEVEMSSRDIGIRMALGATRLRILVGVYRRVAVLLCGGTLIGLAITWAASRLIRSVVLVGIGHDVAAVVGLVAGLAATGLAATYLPAHKAATVDPVETLRAE
jgi:predicted permease